MAQNKPSKPSVTLPNNFGGVKNEFSESKISNGYEASTPEIVEGGNLNYMLDGLFRNTKYMRTVLDYVRDTPAGKIFWTNANGQMDYQIPAIIATNTEFNTGTATDRVPNVKQVVDKIATKPNNEDVVHKTGDETISGTKTIANDVIFQRSSTTEHKSSIYRPSDNGFVICMSEQDNSAWMSYLKFFTDGSAILRAKTTLYLQGTVNAPTPSTSDNSTRIATTEFVKNNLTGGVSTIATSNLTASRALISNSNGKVAVSAITSTELGYLDGVTSNVQTQLNAKAADNAVVKLTGNQSIAGTKTFTTTMTVEGSVGSKNTAMTKGTAPSGDQWQGFNVFDKDNKTMARFRQRYTSAKENNIDLMVYKANSADDSATATLRLAYPASGDPYTYCPASDVNNSIVTTVNKSKAQNGYFKLGNGLIIQWGEVSGTGTVTFPTPFSNSYASVMFTRFGDDGTNDNDAVVSITKTSCYIHNYGSQGGRWIAIGY